MKHVKSKENCGYSSRHLYQDLLKVKELIYYVNFVADDATPHALTIDIIMKAAKTDKLLHQVIKLVKQNNCYKLNNPLTFLEYIENHNTFKQFLKTDFELRVGHDLVLKSNRIVIASDLQNHVAPFAY